MRVFYFLHAKTGGGGGGGGGRTALHLACSRGHGEVYRFLLGSSMSS